MENNPFSTNHEDSPDDDGTTTEKKYKKHRPSRLIWRMPLPASELHGEPSKREKPELKPEASQALPKPELHPDLARESDLWEEFDKLEASKTERADANSEPLAQETKEGQDRADPRTMELWEELDTIHLNSPPPPPNASVGKPISDKSAASFAAAGAGFGAAPSAEFTSAPNNSLDPESRAMWDELKNTQPAEYPSWHPDAQLTRPSTNQEFADVMSKANMGRDFVEATSEQGYEQELPAPAKPLAPQHPATAPTPVYGGPTPGSLFGRAAETAALTAAAAKTAAVTGATTGFVAGAAAGAAAGTVAGAMAGRRSNNNQMNQLRQQSVRQNEQITTMSAEQTQMTQRVDQLTQTNRQLAEVRQKEQETRAAAIAAASAAAEAALQEQEHSQPKEHEVSSSWHKVVVDAHTGKVIEREGVNQFGQGLRQEQRPENMPQALSSAGGSAKGTSVTSHGVAQGGGGAYPPPSFGVAAGNQKLYSGQIAPDHELESGQIDGQHMLPAPKNQFAKAMTSPLLWLGVAVLLVAFFAAAFL